MSDPASLSGGTPQNELANRLRRVHRHLRKWAKRTDVTCYRLYERDIADQPLIVDWYDGNAVVWAYARTRNETAADDETWLTTVTAAVCAGLDLPAEKVFLKRRFRQKDRQKVGTKTTDEDDDGPGQYERLATRGVTQVVGEQGLRFEVNLSDYLDTGLFLDHRPTRARVRSEATGKDVLNLFAYTGAFTCYARAGGARRTVTIDLSNTYLEWAGRNLVLNGFAPDDGHVLVRADCVQWLRADRPERFDLIVCDPPTFSNSAAMRSEFAIDRDHAALLERLYRLLRPGGVLYFSTNSRSFRLTDATPPFTVEPLTATSIPEDFRNRRIHQCWRMTRI